MRILVTGLGTFWGSRLAQYLEAQPTVDVLVGVDTREPRVPLERTEFVRVDASFDVLARIVKAAQIDTILHTHLIVDSTQAAGPPDPRDQRHRDDEPPRRGRRATAPCASSC